MSGEAWDNYLGEIIAKVHDDHKPRGRTTADRAARFAMTDDEDNTCICSDASLDWASGELTCPVHGNQRELLARFDKMQADALAHLTTLVGPEKAQELLEKMMKLTIDMLDARKEQS